METTTLSFVSAATPFGALLEDIIRNSVVAGIVDDLQHEKRIEFRFVRGVTDSLEIALTKFRTPVHEALRVCMPARDRRVPATTSIVGPVLQLFLSQQASSIGRF